MDNNQEHGKYKNEVAWWEQVIDATSIQAFERSIDIPLSDLFSTLTYSSYHRRLPRRTTSIATRDKDDGGNSD